MAARPGDAHDAPNPARTLNVSERTLHHQLQEEGISLQRIKHAVRLERAAEMLSRGQLPLKQVALSVGFTSEKTFSRAFRAWTGRSPGAHRSESVALDR